MSVSNEVLHLTREDYERIGDCSIEGKLSTQTNHALLEIKEVCIELPSVSLSWNKQHNGPNYLLIPEHVIRCLLQSVLHLQSLGIKVNIIEYIDDNV